MLGIVIGPDTRARQGRWGITAANNLPVGLLPVAGAWEDGGVTPDDVLAALDPEQREATSAEQRAGGHQPILGWLRHEGGDAR